MQDEVALRYNKRQKIANLLSYNNYGPTIKGTVYCYIQNCHISRYIKDF